MCLAGTAAAVGGAGNGEDSDHSYAINSGDQIDCVSNCGQGYPINVQSDSSLSLKNAIGDLELPVRGNLDRQEQDGANRELLECAVVSLVTW